MAPSRFAGLILSLGFILSVFFIIPKTAQAGCETAPPGRSITASDKVDFDGNGILCEVACVDRSYWTHVRYTYDDFTTCTQQEFFRNSSCTQSGSASCTDSCSPEGFAGCGNISVCTGTTDTQRVCSGDYGVSPRGCYSITCGYKCYLDVSSGYNCSQLYAGSWSGGIQQSLDQCVATCGRGICGTNCQQVSAGYTPAECRLLGRMWSQDSVYACRGNCNSCPSGQVPSSDSCTCVTQSGGGIPTPTPTPTPGVSPSPARSCAEICTALVAAGDDNGVCGDGCVCPNEGNDICAPAGGGTCGGACSCSPDTTKNCIYGSGCECCSESGSYDPGHPSYPQPHYHYSNYVDCTPYATPYSSPYSYPSPAWWQSRDADISSTGDLRSSVPAGLSFALSGSGGYPGIPAYSGTLNLGSGTISSNNWKANSGFTGRRWDYGYFTSLVPPEVFTDAKYLIGSASINVSELKNETKKRIDGYVWNYRNGDLAINGTGDLGDDKVILLVNGNLTIGNNITLNDGKGFFATFVRGNTVLSSQVSHPNNPALEGMFLSDGSFSTGAGSGRMHLRGAVAAWGGIQLQRDLGNANSNTPAEYIEYAPDMILTFPRELLRTGLVWREIAP